jgi:hypothetical protein
MTQSTAYAGGRSRWLRRAVTATDRRSDESYAKGQFDAAYDAMKVFFEWRYYVLTRFMVMVAAVLAASKWLSGEDRAVRVAVLLAACGFSITMLLSDRINARHIRNLYALGIALENDLHARRPGIFETIQDRPRLLTYGRVLFSMYVTAALAFAACAGDTWFGHTGVWAVGFVIVDLIMLTAAGGRIWLRRKHGRDTCHRREGEDTTTFLARFAEAETVTVECLADVRDAVLELLTDRGERRSRRHGL